MDELEATCAKQAYAILTADHVHWLNTIPTCVSLDRLT